MHKPLESYLSDLIDHITGLAVAAGGVILSGAEIAWKLVVASVPVVGGAKVFKRRYDPTVDVARELESFDETNPGWDRAYLVNEAAASLSNGVSLQRIRIIYGSEVADLAERKYVERNVRHSA
ncbi:hypothetical protein WQE_08487 [Paraburkholderia hospita]|uniref:Uncharacterized protein n=1 Tax=Paraburkholderia hospita TaxID=169430 RepID=A0ABN0FRU5_9BURK|nr:hypothetical protein [Paraburkholderia hospita]EIN01529.1 hypothetical protein WQE_08487 [Paraburkholderia hospita]OUL83635.1 hypothetical protein CA602_21695 [Paraburkholderia hospita]